MPSRLHWAVVGRLRLLRSPVGSIPRRARSLILIALLVAACTSSPPGGDRSDPGTEGTASPIGSLRHFERMVCDLPEEAVLRLWRGYAPGRSGQIQIVSGPDIVVGGWLSHSSPWDEVQRIPIVLYGPGRVREGSVVSVPSTIADLAPTLAELLDAPFDAPDGRARTSALLPRGERLPPPRLVLTVVWDSAGRNVLAEHPTAWPTLRKLRREGAWFERAAVGSSPSVTPAVHSTLGTGAFPRLHGVVDIRYTVDGRTVGARGEGPGSLQVPSLADVFDRDRDNEPIVGLVGSKGTLGMLGQGALFPGGDEDIAVTRTGVDWFLEGGASSAFRFPSYAADYPGLEEHVRSLDLEDGLLDGAWMGEPIEAGNEGVSATPAFTEYQARLVEDVIAREGFGVDDVPDLLFVNFREIDAVGHRWSMNSEQMEHVLRATDRALARLMETLDRLVGEGEWVLAVTADHGATPSPEVTGAFVLNPRQVQDDLRAAFDGDGDDRDVLQGFRVTQMWLDLEELEENGSTLQDVARFLEAYTKGDNAPDASALGDRADDRVFAAAFPGAVLEDLPCLP